MDNNKNNMCLSYWTFKTPYKNKHRKKEQLNIFVCVFCLQKKVFNLLIIFIYRWDPMDENVTKINDKCV